MSQKQLYRSVLGIRRYIFVGTTGSIGIASGLIMTPFAKKLINVTGEVQMILVGMMVIGISLLVYAFVV